MKLTLALCAFAALLAGCAAEKMRGYIGQDIRVVELAYGPPINQVDPGNGTRAFQWGKISVDATPITAVTTTDKDKNGRRTKQTQFIGGDQTVTKCLYTFITTWNPERNPTDHPKWHALAQQIEDAVPHLPAWGSGAAWQAWPPLAPRCGRLARRQDPKGRGGRPSMSEIVAELLTRHRAKLDVIDGRGQQELTPRRSRDFAMGIIGS